MDIKTKKELEKEIDGRMTVINELVAELYKILNEINGNLEAVEYLRSLLSKF